jgi:hypothetical protein
MRNKRKCQPQTSTKTHTAPVVSQTAKSQVNPYVVLALKLLLQLLIQLLWQHRYRD